MPHTTHVSRNSKRQPASKCYGSSPLPSPPPTPVPNPAAATACPVHDLVLLYILAYFVHTEYVLRTTTARSNNSSPTGPENLHVRMRSTLQDPLCPFTETMWRALHIPSVLRTGGSFSLGRVPSIDRRYLGQSRPCSPYFFFPFSGDSLPLSHSLTCGRHLQFRLFQHLSNLLVILSPRLALFATSFRRSLRVRLEYWGGKG